MIHIVFFAPYEEAGTVIERVLLERPDKEQITCEIVLDTFNNMLKSISGDAIISRGFTAHTMKKIDLPGAELKTSGYDVIAAVEKCLRQFPCKKIAIVGAFNMVYGSEGIGCVYPDTEIKSYAVFDETLLESKVLEAIIDGAQAIVGGCSSVAIAEKHHMPAFLIELGKEAINNALDDAIQAVWITRKEKQKSNEIANIMNYSFQGIISTDCVGIITLANKYCSLLSDGESIVGRKVCEFFPAIPLNEVLFGGRKILSEIHKFNGHLLMINCVQVEGEQGNTGCVLTFQDITRIQEDEGKIRKRMNKKGFVAKYHFSDILFHSKTMCETIRIASDFSTSGSSILVLGETGTGKELFAQSIHNASSRRDEPFVAVNCAALPEELLESELFGYVEGAFTGAVKGGKMGLFEIAHRGTIFLDEIGDISAKLQGRLLRVLQEREIIRLGHDTVIPIDVRVISATNKNLREEVQKGTFRQDLLYRLDVLELNIPPLRERKEDVRCIAEHYISQERETNCVLKDLTFDAWKMLCSYEWPGNVRELRNFCERICVLCRNQSAGVQDVLRALPIVSNDENKTTDISLMEIPEKHAFWENERRVILEALKLHANNRRLTASYLEIDKSTLWRKMKKYGLIGK